MSTFTMSWSEKEKLRNCKCVVISVNEIINHAVDQLERLDMPWIYDFRDLVLDHMDFLFNVIDDNCTYADLEVVVSSEYDVDESEWSAIMDIYRNIMVELRALFDQSFGGIPYYQRWEIDEGGLFYFFI